MTKHGKLAATLAVAVAAAFAPVGQAGMDEAKKWVEKEFQPSTLTKEQQLKEMEWFVNAAKPFKGMEINVLSETIPTHEYESKVLTKAFEEITGIKVNHQVLGEGEVVQAVQTQMQTNRNLYDAYINDSDLIGTHSRLQSAVNNLTNNSTNLTDARSRIQDADFSAESTNLAKAQILSQASTAMLAQANQSSQGVLKLLGG